LTRACGGSTSLPSTRLGVDDGKQKAMRDRHMTPTSKTPQMGAPSSAPQGQSQQQQGQQGPGQMQQGGTKTPSTSFTDWASI
jgi:hypothetical protein